MWAAGVDGLKGLKLGRYKNKTQGFGLEVKWPRLGIYSGRESHMDLMPCYGVLLIASSARVEHDLFRSGTWLRVPSGRRDRTRKNDTALLGP